MLNLLLELVRWLILISWYMPIFFAFQTIIGFFYGGKNVKRYNPHNGKAELIILQIPTIGNADCVNKIFQTVRKYELPLPLQCWVVIEEGDDPSKYLADQVVVVPKNFKCHAHVKARALEYARRFRLNMVEKGQLTSKYMVVQSDDDSIVSRELILDALSVDADVVVGTIKPTKTSTLGLILDYERPYTCMHTCLFFISLGKPAYGHGEAQIYYGYVEKKIDYQFIPLNGKVLKEVPVMGNEDMYWLHKAEIAGFKIYKSRKPVLISPPLSLRDAIKQRRRWLWGNFNIVYIKRMLPLSHALRFVFLHLCAFLFYPLSQLGIFLWIFDIFHSNQLEAVLGMISLFSWYVLRFFTIGKVMGWKHGLIGAAITKVTTFLNFIVIFIGVLQGDPRRFDVIKKKVAKQE